MEKIPFTPSGYGKIHEELKHLKTTERPNVIKAIAEAREHGDLSENAEYKAAREKQSFIEGRILELEDKIARANVIDIKTLSGNVKFGATVTLVDEDSDKEVTYQLVGEYEADLEKGRIAINAPIARAMIGKEEGDSFQFQSPQGTRSYEILAIKYV